jgi:cell shape-determining protein MreC
MRRRIIFLFLVFILGVLSGAFFLSERVPEDELISSLRKENDLFKRAMYVRGFDPELTVFGEESYIKARVFSNYPFNQRDFITLNAGERDGVREGMTVTIGGHTLLGRVESVRARYSIARTIFDPGWSIPVRIGEQNADGLLIGAHQPEISMIEKSASVSSTESVYAASSLFPFGLRIGSVYDIQEDRAGTFRKATVKFDYENSAVKEVLIISDFLPNEEN